MVEIDPNGAFEQDDGIVMHDVSNSWNKAVISKQIYQRAPGRTVYARIEVGADTDYTHFMIGLGHDQTSGSSYNNGAHLIYFNDGILRVYECNTSHSCSSYNDTSRTYTRNTTYEIKIVLKSVGADYYIRGGEYHTWTNIYTGTGRGLTTANMRLGVFNYAHEAVIKQFNFEHGYALYRPYRQPHRGAGTGAGCGLCHQRNPLCGQPGIRGSGSEGGQPQG